MDSIFSYESKLVQMLLKLADMMIMNILYVLCCLPVFTIGAAQAGLHTGIRQLRDPADDSSCTKAFFRGFANGFGKITLVYSLGLLLVGLLVWLTIIVLMVDNGIKVSGWICFAAIFLVIHFLNQVPLFHSNFDCKGIQLPRNVFLIMLAHPLRSLGVTVLIWAPIILLGLGGAPLWMQGLPIWTLLYYSTAFLFCNSVTKKPIDELREDFRKAQEGEAPAAAEAPEE